MPQEAQNSANAGWNGTSWERLGFRCVRGAVVVYVTDTTYLHLLAFLHIWSFCMYRQRCLWNLRLRCLLAVGEWSAQGSEPLNFGLEPVPEGFTAVTQFLLNMVAFWHILSEQHRNATGSHYATSIGMFNRFLRFLQPWDILWELRVPNVSCTIPLGESWLMLGI